MRGIRAVVRILFVLAVIVLVANCADDPTAPSRSGANQPTIAFATAGDGAGLSITTDKDDYAPGDTVWFTGAGWTPGDSVDIALTDDPTLDSHEWTVGISEDGTFRDSTYVVDTGDLGVTFTLTATSRGNPQQKLTVIFTDGNVKVTGSPSGVRFSLTVATYSNAACTTGETVRLATTEGPSFSVGTGSGPSSTQMKLTASSTSTSGGAFINWTLPSSSTSSTNPLCVVNPSGTEDYVANYVPKPDLKVTKTASVPSFSVGVDAFYTIKVENIGQIATGGPVTVGDVLPAAVSFSSISAPGWTCTTGSTISCSRSDALNPAAAYSDIVITVTPLSAAASITNSATASGGGDLSSGNNTGSVTTGVLGVPDLSITKSHAGDFTRGTNEDYTLEVSNVGSAATSGSVTILDTLPAGLTFVSGTGTGWDACTASGQVVTCVRPSANPVASGASAPVVTLTVDVGSGTAASITNLARVSGGGDAPPSLVTCNGSHNNCDADATTVVNSNSPPVAVDDSYSTNEDAPLSVNATDGVLGNDTDPDGNALTAVLVSGPDPAKTAAFSLAADGSFNFTPAADFFGSVTFTYRANDGLVNSAAPATVTITVNPVNDPPSFTKGGDQTVLEDAGAQSVTNWATGISAGPSNESAQTVSFDATDNSNPGLFSTGPVVSSTGTLTYTPAANANGSATITLVAKDNGGTANGGDDTSPTQTFKITVTAVNDAPSFDKGGNESANEGAGAQSVSGWAAAISAGPPDESGQTLAFEITGNTNPGIFSVAPAVAANGTLTYTPSLGLNGSSTITIRLKDSGGIANGGADTSPTQTFSITVNNVLPTLGAITAPNDPLQVGTLVTASATFTDPGTDDPHTTSIDWGDGAVTTHNVAAGSTTASGTHIYSLPGVYTLKMKVLDDVGYSNEVVFQYVVIFDPSAGFVTGGGWIMSPAGAYTPDNPSDQDIVGKATFGFVSKYQKGASAPAGNTEFQFHAANLNFKSTLYEWLVVQGNSRASYKGSGTVNGGGNYGFLLSTVDGGNVSDKFRIKIWDKGTGVILYDNQVGAGDDALASQLIGDGSIVIHSK